VSTKKINLIQKIKNRKKKKKKKKKKIIQTHSSVLWDSHYYVKYSEEFPSECK
jgi:hypothetical protein